MSSAGTWERQGDGHLLGRLHPWWLWGLGGWLGALWGTFGVPRTDNSAGSVVEPTGKGRGFIWCRRTSPTSWPPPGRAGPPTRRALGQCLSLSLGAGAHLYSILRVGLPVVLADAWPGPLLPWGASALPEGEGALSLSFRFSHCFLGFSGDAWPACVSGETGSPLSGAMCLCSSSGLNVLCDPLRMGHGQVPCEAAAGEHSRHSGKGKGRAFSWGTSHCCDRRH